MNDTRTDIKLPVAVLAGAPAEPEIESRYSVGYRAAVPIGGRMMVQRVVDALRASSRVGDICLVGNIQCEGVHKTTAPEPTLLENLIAGVNACASDESNGRVLVATSDIPLITSEAIDDFIDRCGSLDADFYYAVISKEANEQRFPGMRRTYARLKEGTFTGGNIMVVDAGFLGRNADLIREVLDARKSVGRLARIIGLRTLVRAAIAQFVWAGAVDLAYLEGRVGHILNARIKAVQTPYAEIGADVDDPEQIELVEELIKDL